jgi:hypothetical protein
MATRRRLAQQGFGADHGFRWRGGDMSGLEGLRTSRLNHGGDLASSPA